MKTAITFITISILFSLQIFSQSVSQQWVQRFNGSANSLDNSYAIILDGAGNILVTGYCTFTGTSKDMFVAKYDANGNILWSQSYDGVNHGGDYSYAITTDASNNVYITGRTDGGATYSDYTTIKYNSSGAQQWVSLYNGPAGGFDEAKCISVDNSGNVYVSGSSDGVGTGQDIAVVKYNSSGAQQWVSRYNGPGNNSDIATSMAVDNAGNVYVTGVSIGIGADYATIKYNNAGAEQWVQRYNGPQNGGDAAVSLKLDGLQNVYVTGYSDGGASGYDFATLKYNSAGVQQWLRRYNSAGNISDFATAMAVNSAGDVFITGTAAVNPAIGDSNFATIKYNTDGLLQWSSNYAGPSNSSDVPRAIGLDNLDNVYVTGSSFLPPDLDDFATVKYSSNGAQQWLVTYNGPASQNDYTSAITADVMGNIYVTGRSTGVNSNYDIATIKYGNPVGINPVSTEIPTKFGLYQNYPNPFNPSTRIRFDIAVLSDVSLTFYDIEGREVLNAYHGLVNPGSYEYNVNASDLSSGVYFYRLNAGSFTGTNKMMLIK